MSKAVVIGCACVVISNFTPDQIENLKRYHPEMLTDESGFSIDVDNGPGSIMGDNATFSYVTSSDGKATITVLLDPDEQDKLAMAQKMIGVNLLRLEYLENKLMDQIETLESEIESAKGMFELM